MNALRAFAVGTVKKYCHIHYLVADETNRTQRFGRSVEIFEIHQQVNIACISYGAAVDRCNPNGDGIAANDCIGNLGFFKSPT